MSAQPDTGEMGSVHREGGIWALVVPAGSTVTRKGPEPGAPVGAPALRVGALAELCRAGDVFTPDSPSARGNLVIPPGGKTFRESQRPTQPWESCSGSALIWHDASWGQIAGNIACFGSSVLQGLCSPPAQPSRCLCPAVGPRCVGTRSGGTGLLPRCQDGRFQRWERTRQRGRVSHAQAAPICCLPGPGLAMQGK